MTVRINGQVVQAELLQRYPDGDVRVKIGFKVYIVAPIDQLGE